MLVHLSSHNPDDYGSIKFTSSMISENNKPVMYRVNSLSTTANLSYTTPDDYMKVRIQDDIELTYTFHECRRIDTFNLVNDLNDLLSGALVGESLPLLLSASFNDNGEFCIYGDKDFTIVDASHRVKLLFGLYNDTLPIESNDKVIKPKSHPIVGLDNVLYLTSRYDCVCLTNADKGREETMSIAYKVNEIVYNGYPINSKLPGMWNYVNSDQMNHLEFQLVDFQFHPIALHSPLHVTIEIQRPLA